MFAAQGSAVSELLMSAVCLHENVFEANLLLLLLLLPLPVV
jgi:hypothetical protein